MKLFARFFSFLFHPVLFFLIMPFFVIYKQTDSSLYAMKWVLFSSVFIIFGVMIILFETIEGDFSDFDITKKEQRLKFYIILFALTITYLIASLMLKGVFFPLSIISLGIIFGIIVFAGVNRYIKASVHVAVSSAFVISMNILYGREMFLLLWLIILISWARLYLKKHTISEVVCGGLLGIIITLSTFLIGVKMLLIK
ncbi:MAG: hypothetical protein HYT83_00555 [Candidatus Levybacteria bacterium]|nr:hypothetical protein [Candidatus Levybacteria bacterium]